MNPAPGLWTLPAAAALVLGASAALPRAPAVAVALALSATALPFLAPPVPALRGLFGLATAWHLARVVELARGEAPAGGTAAALRRLWHQLGVVDTRLARSAPPAPSWPALGRALAGALGGGVALAVAARAPPPLRWFAGTWFVYGVAEGVFAGLAFGYGLAGVDVGRLHDDPITARSLREFWGRRWNRVIGRWLHEHAFRPLAEAGHPALGVAAAFVLSAALHVHFAAAGAGPRMGLAMGAFFVVQGALLAAERRLAVDGWSPLPARAWTLGCLFGTAPLFVEPFLRLVPA